MGCDAARAAQQAEAWNLAQHVVDGPCRGRPNRFAIEHGHTGGSLSCEPLGPGCGDGDAAEDRSQLQLNFLGSGPAAKRSLNVFKSLAENLDLKIAGQVCG